MLSIPPATSAIFTLPPQLCVKGACSVNGCGSSNTSCVGSIVPLEKKSGLTLSTIPNALFLSFIILSPIFIDARAPSMVAVGIPIASNLDLCLFQKSFNEPPFNKCVSNFLITGGATPNPNIDLSGPPKISVKPATFSPSLLCSLINCPAVLPKLCASPEAFPKTCPNGPILFISCGTPGIEPNVIIQSAIPAPPFIFFFI